MKLYDIAFTDNHFCLKRESFFHLVHCGEDSGWPE